VTLPLLHALAKTGDSVSWFCRRIEIQASCITQFGSEKNNPAVPVSRGVSQITFVSQASLYATLVKFRLLADTSDQTLYVPSAA
jgi:hypothetical protein